MKPIGVLLGVLLVTAAVVAGRMGQSGTVVPKKNVGTNPGGIRSTSNPKPAPGHQLAAFSGGCFWGTEEQFRQIKGVLATAVGYTGGTTKNPTYEQVCTHTTGHAETVLVEFDPKIVTYKKLLSEFWTMHDPTQLNRQGPDYGDQYRTAIWTYSAEQLKEAKESVKAQQKRETGKIVTQIQPAVTFYLAEDYHQQYDEKTGRNTCPAPRKFKGG